MGFKTGDKAIYLTDEIEVEVEIYKEPSTCGMERSLLKYYAPSFLDLIHYRIIIDNKIICAAPSLLFKENSEEYIIARLNKLERKANRGFFARIFNK
tara:strand:+ start:56 stop:346 length:291 start_codon:yes stop_codon:yes gene_type:complete